MGRKYALNKDELPPMMENFLKCVKLFFTKPLNLERLNPAISNSTWDKAYERIRCYLGFLKTVKNIPSPQLQASIFQNGELVQSYLNYLDVSGLGLEIRTLQHFKETSQSAFALKDFAKENVLVHLSSGDFTFHFQAYKTSKYHGHDEVSIENASGKPFSASTFTKHLKQLFFRLTGTQISINALRSSFITYAYSQTQCSDSLKESIASALRHTRKQSQTTYDRRTANEKKKGALSPAEEFVRASSSAMESRKDYESGDESCSFGIGDFVALAGTSDTDLHQHQTTVVCEVHPPPASNNDDVKSVNHRNRNLLMSPRARNNQKQAQAVQFLPCSLGLAFKCAIRPPREQTQTWMDNRNKNTTKKTRSDLNIFYKWAKTLNETRTIDNIPPDELDKIISHFVVKVCKQNGEQCEPDTLTSYFRSFDRFLREQGKSYSILLDKQFCRSREALSAKRKQLRRFGKGQRPNKALGLSEAQIQQLWQQNQLGNCSSQVLLRTVWFNNTIYFGWRARDEHHRVRFGDFQIREGDGVGGVRYVEWVTERGSKTRTGENEFVPDRPFNPKMFATDGPRCPVKMFTDYMSRRPPDMNYSDAPFYLASIPRPASPIWYKKTATWQALTWLVYERNDSSCWNRRPIHKPFSARRTMISTLRKENVEPLNIIALAGQRNLKSLDSYSEASEEQQHLMSNKISEMIEGEQRKETKNSLKTTSPLASQSNEQESKQGMFHGARFQQLCIELW
ncbi:hypothetical protein QZH41_001175 [Actinostola sp. cb2023]|nr:hypothetical protein QZH41_001175 [Actinostola sp. cb2023]